MSTRAIAFLLLAASALAACRRDADQRTETVRPETMRQAREALAPAVVAQIDSGNAAFRTRDFERARAYYRRAVQLDSTAAAAWFGVYMAETALGDADAAEAALRRAQAAAPRATLLEGEPPPAAADTPPHGGQRP